MELRGCFLLASLLLVTLSYSAGQSCPKVDIGIPSRHTVLKDCNARTYNLTGYRGGMGMPGDRGQPGFRGLKGSAGFDGPPGPVGGRGQKGDAGVIGEMGDLGSPGGPGKDGLRGKEGSRGRDGAQGACKGFGPPGPIGFPGPRGGKGDIGKRGPRGPEGRRGGIGNPGRNGEPGTDGWPGDQGCKGRPGCDGPPGVCLCRTPEDTISHIVRHGQGDDVPCPPDTKLIRSGYSLIQTDDDGRTVSQDLGSVSSCLMQFDTMPFMFCSVNNKCTYASRTGNSFWLSNVRQPMEWDAIKGRDLLNHISTCKVCEVNSLVLAVHSQTTVTPSCPTGWDSLWDGYSFLQTTTGAGGAGQLLHSPGSCLEKYSPYPYLECGAHGTCQYFADLYFYWLVAQDPHRWTPHSPTFNDNTNPQNNISRCRVCKYRN